MLRRDQFNISFRRAGGYSVLELVFYISLFAALSIIIIQALLTMTNSFRETRVLGDLSGGGVIMERLVREIRQAHAINFLSAADLILATKDEAGNDKTVQFTLTSNNLRLRENGVLSGNLNPANLAIVGLTFEQINTAVGTGVRISLSMRSLNDAQGRVFDFFSTAVLRGDY